jgi:hypothetical protein
MTGEITAPTHEKEKSMSSKPKQNGNTEAEAASTQAATAEVPVRNSAPDEEIRRRAYEIYLERVGLTFAALFAQNGGYASWVSPR